MPLYFRKLKLTKWADCEGPYNSIDEIPADPVSDFATQKNELSIWLVDDDRANLRRVVAAFATTMSEIRTLEFALIPHDSLAEAQFAIEQHPGESLDAEANKQLHFDLVRLTGVNLARLVGVVVNSDAIQEFWTQAEVVAALRDSIDRGLIDRTRLNRGLSKLLN